MQPISGIVRRAGLASQDILASRARYGLNVLTPAQRDPWWRLYLDKFDDPVIRILIIAAVIAIAAGADLGKCRDPLAA